MKTIIFFKKDTGEFVPAFPADIEQAKKIKPGTIIFQYGRARNPRAHRLAFALAKCCLENMPDKYTVWNEMYLNNPSEAPYLFIKALQLECGLVDICQQSNGKIIIIPKSIAFEKMSQEEFEPILDTLIEKAAFYLGLSSDEMKRNYVNYL